MLFPYPMSDETIDVPAPRRNFFLRDLPPHFLLGLVVAIIVVGVALWSEGNRCFDCNSGRARSQATASSIINAVESYQSDLGRMPVPDGVVPAKGGSLLVSNQPAGVEFLRMLHSDNLRSVQYFKSREARSKKDGLVYTNDGRIEALYDRWGNPFHILIDTQGNGVLVAKRGKKTETVRDRLCIVFSAGADRNLGTADDVRSW